MYSGCLIDLRGKSDGEFFKLGDWVYYLVDPFFENLAARQLNSEIPLVYSDQLTLGINGISVGYRFRIPSKISKVEKSHILIGRPSDEEWQPFIGLPGIQVYTRSSGGVLITNTAMTGIWKRINH